MDKNTKIILAVVIAVVVVAGTISAAVLLMGHSEAVNYLTIAPKDMKVALSNGDIDGYIAWEPFVSDSVVAGVGTVLEWSSEMMPNHPCCVVAVSTSFLKGPNGLELTERFLKAHEDATAWMNDALEHPSSSNYTLLVDLAVQFTKRNASVVKEAFGHLKFSFQMGSEFKESLRTFTDMYIELNMTSTSKLTTRGYSSATDFINKFVNDTPLAGASAIQPSDTIINAGKGNEIKLGFLDGDLHQMAQVVAQNVTAGGGVKSMFTKYGINVTNAVGAPYAAGGAEMTVGFATGGADIGYLGAPPAILNHLNGGVQVTIVAQANTEGSGIVVRTGSGIDSLEGLVNKTVATPGESSIQFLLLKNALEEKGLSLKIKT